MVNHEDELQFAKLVDLLNRRVRFALFVGAGISASAGVPTSSRIIKTLLRLRLINEPMSYPEAMGRAFKTAMARRAFLERTFVGKPPSNEHFMLAHLAENNVFRNILTTNFDHLTEIALAQSCSSVTRVYLHKDTLESIKEAPTINQVVKLHGDFLFDSLANTDAEMDQAISTNLRQKLSLVLKDSGLVVLGYGGDDSILRIITELACDAGTLEQGIWWIFHQPPGEREGDTARRAEQAKRIQDFLSSIRSCGKPAEFIRNAYGCGWFLAQVSRMVTGTVPTRPLFGIGQGLSLAPNIGLIGPAAPTGYEHPLNDPHYEALKAATTKPGVIILTGPMCSGKTRLIARFMGESGTRLVFYFSFAFCRNEPMETAFYRELGGYLELRGLLTEKNSGLFWPELVFREGGVLILDDLPVSPIFSRKGVEPGGFHSAFLHIVAGMSAAHRKTRLGNLIVIRPPNLPEEVWNELETTLREILEVDLTHIQLQEDEERLPPVGPLYKNLDGKQQRVLREMAWLRFGEPIEVLSQIAGMGPGLGVMLKDFVQLGVVATHAARYVLRLPYRMAALNREMRKSPTDRLRESLLRVAQCFERIAEQPETLYPIHYFLEAENAYYNASMGFKAEKWSAGLKCLAKAVPTLSSYSPSRDVFLFSTLRDYFANGEKRILSDLNLRDLTTLSSVFAELGAVHATERSSKHDAPSMHLIQEALREGDAEDLRRIVDLVAGSGRNEWRLLYQQLTKWVDERDPWLARFLDVYSALGDASPIGTGSMASKYVPRLLEIKNSLRARKRKRRRAREDWVLLGAVNSMLAKIFTSLHELRRDPSVFSRALRYAQLSWGCCRRAGDNRGMNAAERLLGVLLLNEGNYPGARKLFLQLVRRHFGFSGFDPFKAADLYNLCCAFLGIGALSVAEGFFHESNYHYLQSRLGGFLGPLATIATVAAGQNPLAVGALRRAPANQVFPPPIEIADKLGRMWQMMPEGHKRHNLFKVAQSLAAVADSYADRGDYNSALRAFRHLERVCKQSGRRYGFDRNDGSDGLFIKSQLEALERKLGITNGSDQQEQG